MKIKQYLKQLLRTIILKYFIPALVLAFLISCIRGLAIS